jgi:hypothetical protein
MDFVDDKQTLLGYKTLNLLNAHEDPTALRTVLYLQAARDYVPAPKANFVRVVINGESWGIYPNQQQYNKEFLDEWFKTTVGARWKVPGSPQARGGSSTGAKMRRATSGSSRSNQRTIQGLGRSGQADQGAEHDATAQLEQALAPMLNVDEVLRFLAVDATLVNNDGYWTRASDYSIYEDPAGRVPDLSARRQRDVRARRRTRHGTRRARRTRARRTRRTRRRCRGLRPAWHGSRRTWGPGGRGGMMMGSASLDPLVGLEDASKPLRSKLLAVPALRERYMSYVKQIATKWLDWNTLGPLVQTYQMLIEADVKRDTRKLNTNEEFPGGSGDAEDVRRSATGTNREISRRS